MIQHYINDSSNAEWLRAVRNIDGSDPNASYTGGLPYDPVCRCQARDWISGCTDYRIVGEALVIIDYLGVSEDEAAMY